MSRTWFWLLAGMSAGFGFLFFTIWADSLPDSRTIAAVLFASCSALLVAGESLHRRGRNCRTR